MRILFVIKSVTLGAGGAERVLADVSSALARRGHDVTVASFDPKGTKAFYEYPDVRLIGLDAGDVASHTTLSEIAGRIPKLHRALRQFRPDATVGFMHSAYILTGVASLGTGVPLIASEHISYDHYSTRPLERVALRLAPLLCAAMAVQSESVRAGFPPGLRGRMAVIPNPVTFSPCERGTGRSRKTILAVGRLEEQKDQRTLIDAFARIADRFPDWDLRIVGEGRLRLQLEEAIARNRIEARVQLPGMIQNIGPEYAAADIFAMPSVYESFGIATAEALASDLPAVGFADCPGTNELIEDRVNGLLVSGPDRTQALAEGLAGLMADDQLRAQLGKAGPASIAGYSLDAVVDRWEELISRIVSQGDGHS